MRVVGGVRRGATAESAKRRLTPPTKERQRPDRSSSSKHNPKDPFINPLLCSLLCKLQHFPMSLATGGGVFLLPVLSSHCYNYCCNTPAALPRSGNPNNMCRGLCKTVIQVVHKRRLGSPAGGCLSSGSPDWIGGHTPARHSFFRTDPSLPSWAVSTFRQHRPRARLCPPLSLARVRLGLRID